MINYTLIIYSPDYGVSVDWFTDREKLIDFFIEQRTDIEIECDSWEYFLLFNGVAEINEDSISIHREVEKQVSKGLEILRLEREEEQRLAELENQKNDYGVQEAMRILRENGYEFIKKEDSPGY